MKVYSTQRPVSIGTYPTGGVIEIVNFDYRTHVDEINRPAWGYIEYSRELSEKELSEYELVPVYDGLTIDGFRQKVDPFFMDDQIQTMVDYIKGESAHGRETESELIERMLLDISDAVFSDNPVESLEYFCGIGVTENQIEALKEQIMIEW